MHDPERVRLGEPDRGLEDVVGDDRDRQLVRVLTIDARSRPSSSSITMYGAPFSLPTSYTRQTCSLRSRADARASRSSRSTTAASLASSGNRNFSATGWSITTLVAATTVPIPPWPRIRSTRYLPAIRSPCRMGPLGGEPARGSAARRHGASSGPRSMSMVITSASWFTSTVLCQPRWFGAPATIA